ncbi:MULTISPECIES: hypothetical protein [unclassified Agrococcus]|uniref:DUF7882 family protein n=1 Tax=unclassified Agrococcus TaxID=2615065 RepID=UPI00360C9441
MATLHLGATARPHPLELELDDATLLHVALVLVTRLRGGEPTLLRWQLACGTPGSAWIDATSDVRLRFDDPGDVALDRARLDAMLQHVAWPGGLELGATRALGATEAVHG